MFVLVAALAAHPGLSIEHPACLPAGSGGLCLCHRTSGPQFGASSSEFTTVKPQLRKSKTIGRHEKCTKSVGCHAIGAEMDVASPSSETFQNHVLCAPAEMDKETCILLGRVGLRGGGGVEGVELTI